MRAVLNINKFIGCVLEDGSVLNSSYRVKYIFEHGVIFHTTHKDYGSALEMLDEITSVLNGHDISTLTLLDND